MIKQWLAWAMSLLVVQGVAQSVTVDTISAMQPWSPYEEFSFPHFISSDQPQLAARIDRDLCIELLEVDPDTAKGSIFQLAWGDPAHEMPQRLNSLTWSSNEPLPEVLSVMFAGEGCGAYCEGFTVHHNYDLRDGQRLRFDSLFTKNGALAVDDTLSRIWRTKVEAEMRSLRDSLDGKGLSAESKESWDAVLDMYRQCLPERMDQRPYVADFEPLDRILRVYIARCSAHVDRDADVLGEVSVDLPYKWLAPYLRPEVAPLFRE